MSTKSNKNTTGKGAAKLLAVLLVIGFLIYVAAAGLGKNRSGSVNDIKLGLDLAGGVSITYQAVGEEPTSTDMADTVYKLQLRAQNYSNEAEVYQEGSNRINVDIPGVSDANEILQELGKPGSLTFQDQSGNVLLTGMDVQSAEAGIMGESNNREYVVSLTFTEEGAAKFAEATTERVGQIIYIIYDNEVVSNPVVRTAITGGQCSIEGMASYEEADILASTIRIGALPVELEEIRSNVVGAKLGQEAISTSLMAGAIGFGLGIERLMMILEKLNGALAEKPERDVYIGSMGEAGLMRAQALTYALRRSGVRADCDTVERSVKAQMKYANKIGRASCRERV